jgi:type IV pilus assembly protein PilC
MAIKYEAYTRRGQKVKGVLQTDSTEQAYEMLDKEELIPYRLRPVRTRPSLVRLMPGLFKPKQQDIINFTRQMAALLNSGIPFRQSLLVMRDQAGNPGLKEALRQITTRIQEGERISAAFAPHTTVFPEFYLRLLRVGEGTGGLQVTLEQLTNNLQRRKDVADRVRRALVYPAFNLIAALGAGILLVTYTLPALTNVLKDFGGDLPASSRLLLSISDFFRPMGST